MPVLCVLGLCAQLRRDVTCADDVTELCVEKGITLGIHVHTSPTNASRHSTGRACTPEPDAGRRKMSRRGQEEDEQDEEEAEGQKVLLISSE